MSEVEELVGKAMIVYDTWAKDYQTTRSEYEKLISEMRKLRDRGKVTAIRPIPKTVLEDYPNVEFLKLQSREDAFFYVENMTITELRRFVDFVENVVLYDYSYRTIRERNKDMRHILSNYEQPRNDFGLEPDSCINHFIGSKERTPKFINDDD